MNVEVRSCAVLVVDGLLEQRGADALRDAALGLALDVGGIEPRAAVVGDPVLEDVDLRGLDVDLDQHQMAGVGRREVALGAALLVGHRAAGRGPDVGRLRQRIDARRQQVAAREHGLRDLLERHAAPRACPSRRSCRPSARRARACVWKSTAATAISFCVRRSAAPSTAPVMRDPETAAARTEVRRRRERCRAPPRARRRCRRAK